MLISPSCDRSLSLLLLECRSPDVQDLIAQAVDATMEIVESVGPAIVDFFVREIVASDASWRRCALLVALSHLVQFDKT